MKKLYFLAMALCNVYVAIHAASVFTHSTGEELPLCSGMSENRQYVVGTDELIRTPMLWEVSENVIVDWLYEKNDTIMMGGFNAVNNQGIIVGKLIDENTTQSWAISADVNTPGEVVFLDHQDSDYGSDAMDISEDGKTIVGFYNADFSDSKACIWKDGKRIDLPVPTAEELGFKGSNTKALNISSDAKIIAGGIEAENGYMVLITWTLDKDGNYQVGTPAKTFYGTTYAGFKPMGLSKNGAWALVQVKVKLADGDWDSCDMPQTARLELSTGKLEVLGDPCDWTPWLSAIANDGTAVGYTQDSEDPDGDGFPDAAIWKAGQKNITLLSSMYGNDEFFKQQTASKLCGITADGEYLMGYAGDAEASQAAFIVAIKKSTILPEQIGKFVVSPYESDIDLMSMLGEYMSRNKKYVVGTDQITTLPVAWNVEKEEAKLIKFKENMILVNTETGESVEVEDILRGELRGVTDDGIAMGVLESNYSDHAHGFIYNIETEEISLFYEDKRFETNVPWAMTPDGKIIVGFVMTTKDDPTSEIPWGVYACVWTEGGKSRCLLPTPSAQELGFEPMYAEARWISDNGKVILGFVESGMGWLACHWIHNADGTYTPHATCAPYYTSEYIGEDKFIDFTPKAISANGEWISLNVQKEFDFFDFSATPTPMQAARLNLNTNKLEVLDLSPDEVEEYSPEMFSIADNGTTVGRLTDKVGNEQAVIWYADDNKITYLADMFQTDEYVQYWESSSLSYITAGGNCVMGYSVDEDQFQTTFYVYINDNPDPEYMGINNTYNDDRDGQAHKVLQDGKLLIIKNGVSYDVVGRVIR